MIHMCMNIKGALRNRLFDGFIDDAGSPATKKEAEAYLRDLLSKGHRFLPMGNCPNFDPQRGCCCEQPPAALAE